MTEKRKERRCFRRSPLLLKNGAKMFVFCIFILTQVLKKYKLHTINNNVKFVPFIGTKRSFSHG